MDKILMNKVAEYVQTSLGTIKELKNTLKTKEAAELEREESYQSSLKKAANALYESDFLTDDFEKKEFMKKAKEDPTYLASVIIKVCNAADVSLIGKPARVAATKTSEYDPVMARAFGSSSGNLLDM